MLRLLSTSLLFCLLTAFVAKAGDGKSFIWGINGHPLVSYPGVSFEEQLDLVADLGMTSYRVDVTSIEQTRRLADLIDKAEKRGVTILPVLIPPVGLK
jgi:hypothetical protein